MNKKLKNQLLRIVEEVLSEQPAPVIEPPTKPAERPPAPSKPTERPNPLKPTRPGIAPRPKALSHDVQAFLNKRNALKEKDRKSTRLNSSHSQQSRMPSSA